MTFELEPPTLVEMERRIWETLISYPWLVATEQNQVLGYAYACAFRSRKAWRWSVETSVYVAQDAHRRGIGAALYEQLLSILKAQGFVSAIAVITLPNPASVRVHECFGFEQVGVFKNVGYKCDSWHDVAFFELGLNSPNLAPREPAGLDGIADVALSFGFKPSGIEG
jgi:phosphinothricin acetyltransferase